MWNKFLLSTFVTDTRLLRLRAIQRRGANGQRVVEGLRRGEQAAVLSFDRYMDYFGRALSVVLNIVDPDCVVLGGGVSNVDEIYERAPEALRRYIFNDEVKTPILKNVHGDSSGVQGAALLWEGPDQ